MGSGAGLRAQEPRLEGTGRRGDGRCPKGAGGRWSVERRGGRWPVRGQGWQVRAQSRGHGDMGRGRRERGDAPRETVEGLGYDVERFFMMR